ncbi:MAG: Uma2 family endonuclease [Bacteroidetes bacterium]|nr:MAG: Uma2 family endonuclease [Bacteroidota bacterium]
MFTMGAGKLSDLSYTAYLKLLKESPEKLEYHDGFVTAMAGGTLEHSLITMNTGRALGNVLEDAQKPCRVFSSDARIRIEATNRSFFPDLSVVCGEIERGEDDPHALTNPLLIVEVLSASTGDFDRGAKFAHYRRLPSLREYVLIHQEQVQVDAFYRTETGAWEITTRMELASSVPIKSLGIELPLATLYRQVPGLGD